MQAKAPAGANSSTTSGFAARVLDAKPPYYHDDGGVGTGKAEWYAPGDEPSGPDNCPEAYNADQTDTDGFGDACEVPVVGDRRAEGKVLGPGQGITVEQALRAMTLDAAYLAFEEDRKGTPTEGKPGDVVVLKGIPTRSRQKQ